MLEQSAATPQKRKSASTKKARSMAYLAVGLAKSVAEGALSKAQAAIKVETKLPRRARPDLEFIVDEFEMMQLFLDTINEERIENKVVSTWVRKIHELAYSVEDCMELVIHLDKEEKPSFWYLIRQLLLDKLWPWPWMPAPSTWMPAPSTWMPASLAQAVHEIEQLKARVEGMSARSARYNLISDTGSNPAATAAEKQQLSSHGVDVATEKGRQWNLTKLLNHNDLGIISIWGTGGGGHLGLASIWNAYIDEETCQNFVGRAWVKVMHPFDPHEFIRSLTVQFYATSSLSGGVQALMKLGDTREGDAFARFVLEYRFLIVLEDLSTMAEWDAISNFFPDMKNGSCIILSTHKFEIASLSVGHPYQVLHLNQLSPDHSVYAFFTKGSGDNRDTDEETMVDYSSDVGRVFKIEDSHTDGDKGKKPVDKDFCLVGRESLMEELHQYPAKARLKSCQVMSVWGIPGVGKSALVKKLYDDTRCYTKLFEEYLWVDVSHPFNLWDFRRSISPDFSLAEQGWLIVIDDVRSKKEWDLMQASLVLPKSSKSVIVVIATEASIASYCANSEELIFNVRGLEAAAASSLFKKVCNKDPSALEDMEVQELILKCGGLPKVIVAIAGVLAKQTVTWGDTVISLNHNFIHHLETNPDYDSLNDLSGWLHSYFHTCPISIKPCIFYLSIFPRDRPIRRRRLVRRWIAEGYSRDGEEESAEENGEKQFSELFDLSIIQQLPHLVTNAMNTRMVLCQVNGFIREYIIPRGKTENFVFELGANCALNTHRTGRHLIIFHGWNRDRIVFENMDFSRLRSLTVFGEWKSYLISENMMFLRVLDLEDASGVEYVDLENILKWLHRLKFLSLRGHREIYHLPGNMDHLRQLQTLDVRGTSILTLPENMTKLQKLQYIRAGSAVPATSEAPHPSSWFSRRHPIVIGVQVPKSVGKLTALHTLGVVNVAASGGKTMAKALKKLTQLHKLGLSGINRMNSKHLGYATSRLVHLESLSMRFSKDNQGYLDDFSFPWGGKLQSLKLYGLNDKLPLFIQPLSKLTKLDLEIDSLNNYDIEFLAKLPELYILRLRVKQQLQDGKLDFYAHIYGIQLDTYEKVKILEIACTSSKLHVTFGSRSMKNLELLKIDCSSALYQLTGLDNLSQLKQVLLLGVNDETIKTQLESQLSKHPKRPSVKLEEAPYSS